MAISRGSPIVLPRRAAAAPALAVLRRSWPSVLAGGAALAVLLALAWRSGGYFPPAYLAAGAAVYAVLGVVLLARAPHYRLTTHALVAVGGLAALAVWTGVSSRWSSAPPTALEDMQRTLLYVGLFGLGLVAAGSGRMARHLVWMVLLVVVVIVGAGLVSRLYPDVIPTGLTSSDLGAYRLGYPLAYWNAYGALAALGAVLALGLAADPRAPLVLRPLAAAASVALAVAMYLSLSRGAWLAIAVGIVVLVALSAHRGSLLVSAGLVVPAAAAAIAGVQTYPALLDDPHRGSGQLVQGHAYASKLLLLLVLVGAGQAVFGGAGTSANLMQALRRVFRPVFLVVGAVLAIALIGGYLVKASAVDRHAAQGLADARHWVDRQWRDFMRPATISEGGAARLSSAKGSRSDHYRVALDGFRAHPLWGDGAGGFEVRWMRERRVPIRVRNAHSLYHETLGELGLIGGGLLLLFLVSLLGAAIRSRRRPRSLSRSQAAAVAAACSVWVVHSGFDWDWQVPALTGTALVLAATLFPYGRRSDRPKNGNSTPDATAAVTGVGER